jgi:hypothetical protein
VEVGEWGSELRRTSKQPTTKTEFAMDLQTTFDDSARTFVDAGTAALEGHHFVSEELNKKRLIPLTMLLGTADGEPEGDKEKGVQFRLNQTGNIFYSMSSRELQGETKKLFESVTVLFAAMTKALASKNKTIFDYDAWGKIIAKSGYFIEVQKFQKTLSLKSGSLTIDTQVIQQLIPGLTSGSSLEIAKGVLNALNGEFKKEEAVEKTKLAHILFICEELFGAPSVTVRLFFASQESHKAMTSTPCHKTTSVSFEQLQEANTFLFVSPRTIAEFAGTFGDFPDEYNKLIGKLSGYVDG